MLQSGDKGRKLPGIDGKCYKRPKKASKLLQKAWKPKKSCEKPKRAEKFYTMAKKARNHLEKLKYAVK